MIKEISVLSPDTIWYGKRVHFPNSGDYFDGCEIDTATHVFTIYDGGPRHYFKINDYETKKKI